MFHHSRVCRPGEMEEFEITALRFKGNWRAIFEALGGFRTLSIYGCVLVLAVLVLYLDRTGVISNAVRAWGPGGIVLAVLLMAILCLTPVPSEGLLVIYMKVYGIWWGVLYSWVGALLSALIIFPIARKYGQSVMLRFVPEGTFIEIDDWVRRKGTFGLLIARLLPLPGFAISYVAGVLPSIRLWAYFWTAAVSLIPYYVGASLVFLGITTRFTGVLAVGAVALAMFWAIGYWFHRRNRHHR